jgi:hypothetical protein
MNDTEIDFDALVELIEQRGIPAYVEQTGGGCATIMVGTPDADENFPVLAGPGWFVGPGWTLGRGTWEEFCWGRDDQGETDPMYEEMPRPLDQVADDIVALVKTVEAERHA